MQPLNARVAFNIDARFTTLICLQHALLFPTVISTLTLLWGAKMFAFGKHRSFVYKCNENGIALSFISEFEWEFVWENVSCISAIKGEVEFAF